MTGDDPFPGENTISITITPEVMPDLGLTKDMTLQMVERDDRTWVYWNEVDEYGAGLDLESALRDLFHITNAYRHLLHMQHVGKDEYWNEVERKYQLAFSS